MARWIAVAQCEGYKIEVKMAVSEWRWAVEVDRRSVECWREVVVYRRKSDDCIVLWFGGDEYEGYPQDGLPGYHQVAEGSRIKIMDNDGLEIKWRTHNGPSTLEEEAARGGVVEKPDLPPQVKSADSLLQTAIATSSRDVVEGAIELVKEEVEAGFITQKPRGKNTPPTLARAHKVVAERNALPAFTNALLDVVNGAHL